MGIIFFSIEIEITDEISKINCYFAILKNTTARLFMLLASVLILKICIGQSAFVSISKTDSKSNFHAADSQKDIVLNITNSELEEDETEENGTKDFFIELDYLATLHQFIQIDNTINELVYNNHNFTNNISIYKANNCFRI
jgi:hypothetical protein